MIIIFFLTLTVLEVFLCTQHHLVPDFQDSSAARSNFSLRKSCKFGIILQSVMCFWREKLINSVARGGLGLAVQLSVQGLVLLMAVCTQSITEERVGHFS